MSLETRIVSLAQAIGSDIKSLTANKADVTHTHTLSAVSPIRYGGGMRYIAGAVGGTALTTLALTANRLYLIPFVPPRNMTIANLAIEVTTASAGNCNLGLYQGNYSDVTLNLVADGGVVSTGTAGVVNGAAINYALTPGNLYYAALNPAAVATVRAVAVAGQYPWFGWTQGSSTVRSYIYGTNTQANGLPATITSAQTITAGLAMLAVYLVEA